MDFVDQYIADTAGKTSLQAKFESDKREPILWIQIRKVTKRSVGWRERDEREQNEHSIDTDLGFVLQSYLYFIFLWGYK